MRVLALGGCGGIGRHAVRVLLDDAEISAVVIADIDSKRAAGFAAECGPKATSMAVDVTDSASLDAAMADVDVVMNTVGPYFEYGLRTLEAAIRAQVHYLDVNDDWEPTLAMLDLDERARAAGVTAVLGLGVSPGVSNLLAVMAIAALEGEPDSCVTEVITGWNLDSARVDAIGKAPSASMVHGIHQLTGEIRVLSGGALVAARPIAHRELDYPGLGRRSVWTIGHPEPVTLPRTYPQLRDSTNVMFSSRLKIAALRMLSGAVNAGLMNTVGVASLAERLGGTSDPKQTPAAVLAKLAKTDQKGIAGRLRGWLGGRQGLPPLFAVAVGVRQGAPASAAAMLTSAPPGGMAGVTGVPLGVGVSMLARGRIERRGVFAPEAVVSPADFYARFAPLCSPPRAGGEELVVITRSWQTATLGERLRHAMRQPGQGAPVSNESVS